MCTQIHRLAAQVPGWHKYKGQPVVCYGPACKTKCVQVDLWNLCTGRPVIANITRRPVTHTKMAPFSRIFKKKSRNCHRNTVQREVGMAGHGRRPRTAGVVKRRAGHAQDHSIEHTSCFSLCTAQHVRVEKLFGSMHRCLQLLAAESERLSARICRLKRA